MTELAKKFWERALETLGTAELLLAHDPNASISRSYYAAFYACSGLFALQGKKFKKHTALETAIHRDLVHKGIWPQEFGEDYDYLIEARGNADYVMIESFSRETAAKAVTLAKGIIAQVAKTEPAIFKFNI